MSPVSTVQLTVATAEAMRALGERLGAHLLRAGDLVLLDGPLGAGKTTLTQGIARGLGVQAPVRSPTYTVADVHTGTRAGLLHVDAWRLGSSAELDDLDLDTDGVVTVVEWGVGRAEQLAERHLLVRLARAAGGSEEGDARTVELVPRGDEWVTRLAEVAPGFAPEP